MNETIKTYNQDALIIMQDLINNGIKVDAIIVDPPYSISKKSNLDTMPDRRHKRTGTDFGTWDYNFNNKKWIELASKLLKNGGTIIAFNDFKKATLIHDLMIENDLIFKDTLIWHKTNPMPRNRDRRFISNVEMAQLYVKGGGKWTFNRQNEKYESCILSYPAESGGGFKRYHPTQKNLKMIKYLMKIITNENDLVLDPFAGSFTTAVAAKLLNRRFIGIELDKNYYNIGIKRIKDLK